MKVWSYPYGSLRETYSRQKELPLQTPQGSQGFPIRGTARRLVQLQLREKESNWKMRSERHLHYKRLTLAAVLRGVCKKGRVGAGGLSRKLVQSSGERG